MQIILDTLFATWIFFPILVCLLALVVGLVREAVDSMNSEYFSALLIAVVGVAVFHRYPELKEMFPSFRSWGILLGGYVLVGFAMTIYRWLSVLIKFKNMRPKEKIESLKAERAELMSKSPSRWNDDNITSCIHREFPRCEVNRNEHNVYTVYPDWREYPIALWWAYWPVFMLEIPFDFAAGVFRKLSEFCRNFYNRMAKNFSVNA